MTSKTRIAVLVAALFLGAQAGIAALDQDPSAVSAESAEPAQEQQAEATAPAAAEAATSAGQPAAVAVALESDVFPRSTDDKELLPALAAYLKEREAYLGTLVALGDVFPPSTDDKELLPVTIAYLEQREAALVALAQPQQPESAAAENRPLMAPLALDLHQQAAGTSN